MKEEKLIVTVNIVKYINEYGNRMATISVTTNKLTNQIFVFTGNDKLKLREIDQEIGGFVDGRSFSDWVQIKVKDDNELFSIVKRIFNLYERVYNQEQWEGKFEVTKEI
jgi:hypothetical protein